MKKYQYLDDVLGGGDDDSEKDEKASKIRKLRSHPSVIQAVQTYQNLFRSIDSLNPGGVESILANRDLVLELELSVLDPFQIEAFVELIREKEPKEITENTLTGNFITRLIRESYEAGNNGFSLNLNGGEMKSFGKNLKGTSSNSLIMNVKGSLGHGSASGQENCIMNVSDCVLGEFAENSKNSIYVIEKEMQGKSLGKGSTSCSFRVKGDTNIKCETSDKSKYNLSGREKMKERFDFDWYWREFFYPTIRRTKAKEKLGGLGERVGKVNDWVLKKAELENIVDDREIDYWKEKLGENGWMMSVADFYNIMKNRKNFVKEALTSEDILTSFRKKMKESIGTSTEILRLENGNIQIVHRYGFSSEKRIEMPFPEFKPDKIEEVMKTNDGRKYVSALLGTSDSAKTIKETLKPLAVTIGINLPRDDTERQHCFFTLETEDEDPELTELLEKEDELPEFPLLKVSSLWSSRMRDDVSYGITTDTEGFVEEPEWLKKGRKQRRMLEERIAREKSVDELPELPPLPKLESESNTNYEDLPPLPKLRFDDSPDMSEDEKDNLESELENIRKNWHVKSREKSLDDVVRREKIILPEGYFGKIVGTGCKIGLCLGLAGGALAGCYGGSKVEDQDHFLYQAGVLIAAGMGLIVGAGLGFMVAARTGDRENIPKGLVLGGISGIFITGGGAVQSGNAAVCGGIVIGSLLGTVTGVISGTILGCAVAGITAGVTGIVNNLRGYRTG